MNTMSSPFEELSNTATEYLVSNTLSHRDFDRICRTCLGEDNILPIYRTRIADVPATDLIDYSVALKVCESDLMPQNICENCLANLYRIYEFKKQCQENDGAFRLILHSLDTVEKSGDLPCDLNPAADEHEFKLNCSTEKKNATKCKPVESSLLVCKQCGETYATRLDLKKHQREAKHAQYMPKQCEICLKSYSWGKHSQHMRTHTKEKPYGCGVCHRRFSMKGNLKRHEMIHSGERPYACSMCGKGFIQATSLNEHEKKHKMFGKLPRENLFRCEFCGRSFKHLDAFHSHVNRHSNPNHKKENPPDCTEQVRVFTCELCPRSYKTKNILKAHLMTHGEKSYLCSNCGKGFVTNAGLQSHLRVHTRERPYACIICQKAFAHTTTLDVHMLTHTGEKPHSCELCPKAFTQISHLKYHMRTHSGEKPYICAYCGKSFALKGNLTVHVRTHTGETPYKCDMCGKGFYDSSSMKKHRKHHKDWETN